MYLKNQDIYIYSNSTSFTADAVKFLFKQLSLISAKYISIFTERKPLIYESIPTFIIHWITPFYKWNDCEIGLGLLHKILNKTRNYDELKLFPK